MSGSGDHGPVQAITTTINTMIGIKAEISSRGENPSPEASPNVSYSMGSPPNPNIVRGFQNLSSTSRAAKQTTEPTTSGRYGPRNWETGNWPAIYASEPTTASGHPSLKPLLPATR